MRILTSALAVSLLALSGIAHGATLNITSFTGTIDSIDVFLNGIGTVATGPISITLDTDDPATVTLGSAAAGTAGTFSASFDVSIDMPLFHTLGIPPDTMQYSETGLYIVDTTTGDLSSNLAGGGNTEAYGIAMADINNNWFQQKSSSAGVWTIPTGDLTLTFPQNDNFDPTAPQVFLTEGSGTFTVSPEPSDFLLLGTGLIGLGMWSRRSRLGVKR